MISFISSLEIINVLKPNLNIVLWIAAFVADAGVVNPIGVKTLLANVLSIFDIKGNLVFSNGPKSLPKTLPCGPIFCNWVSDNFILAEELFAKALQSLETCVWFNSNLWGKLFSSSASSTCVLFISVMQSVNGAQFLNISFLFALFTAASAAVVFGTVIVPLTSVCASL